MCILYTFVVVLVNRLLKTQYREGTVGLLKSKRLVLRVGMSRYALRITLVITITTLTITTASQSIAFSGTLRDQAIHSQ